MTIIDAHCHIFPEKIAGAAVNATQSFYAGVKTPVSIPIEDIPHHVGTPGDLLACEKQAGISRCLVFSTATKAGQVSTVNDFIASECRKHPEFIGAGTMHPDFPDFEAECDRMLRLGLRGIKIHPDIQGFAMDDVRILPLYEIMQEKHMFLIAHTGDYRFDFSGPARALHAASLFPRLRFVCAHFGGWSQWEDAIAMLNRENIYVDTSSTIAYAGDTLSRRAFSAYDPTHIFFGTDYPMWTPSRELALVKSLGLDEDFLDGVFHRNFEEFLNTL